MPTYRVIFDVSVRLRTEVTAPNENIARRTIHVPELADQDLQGVNPQPCIDTEVVKIGTRRRVIQVIPL